MKVKFFFIIASLAQLLSNANASTERSDDWVALQYMSNENSTYETSFIKTDGFFNVDVTVWLRSIHEINQNECGSKPQSASSTYSGGTVFTPELIANRNYAICTGLLAKKNKVALYKILLMCSKKELIVLQSEAVNYLGESVQNNIQIGSHPGSVGYSVMQRYCKM